MLTAELKDVARICHEVNRAYCLALGDVSQEPWEEAPEWQRHSAVDGVALHLKQPWITPEQSHDNWMRLKVSQGWTYGPLKDEVLKQHPCMVSYDQLPDNQKVKDYLFAAVVGCFAL